MADDDDLADLDIDGVLKVPEIILLGERLTACFLAVADMSEALENSDSMTTRVKKRLGKEMAIVEEETAEMTMTVDMLNILLDSFIADYQSFRETVKEPPLEEVVKLVEYSEAELCALIRHIVPESLSPLSLLTRMQSFAPRFYAAQQTHPHLCNTFHGLLTSLTMLCERYTHLATSLSLAISHLYPLCSYILRHTQRTPSICISLCIARSLWRSLATASKPKMNLYAAHLRAILQPNADGAARLEVSAIYTMLVPVTLLMIMRCDEGEAYRDVLMVMYCVRYVRRRMDRLKRLSAWCQGKIFDGGLVEVKEKEVVEKEVVEKIDGHQAPPTMPERKAPAPITTTTKEPLKKKKKNKCKAKKRASPSPDEDEATNVGGKDKDEAANDDENDKETQAPAHENEVQD